MADADPGQDDTAPAGPTPPLAPLASVERTRLRRAPGQGSHDRAALHRVLDAGWVCHLGVIIDGWPMVVPTIYGRRGEQVYFHGSVASRSLRVGTRLPVCLTVTLVDGIVVARSLFNHSVNYRSAMIYGTAEPLHGAERLTGLRTISDHVVPGQWDYARAPSSVELAQTTVLRLSIDQASVKTSEGPPGDGDGPDGALGLWAGEIPVRTAAGPPVADPCLDPSVPRPAHLDRLAEVLAARMAPPAPG